MPIFIHPIALGEAQKSPWPEERVSDRSVNGGGNLCQNIFEVITTWMFCVFTIVDPFSFYACMRNRIMNLSSYELYFGSVWSLMTVLKLFCRIVGYIYILTY